jgi:predicted nicotinamide N-methyase
VWKASLLLAEWALLHRDILAGATPVVELGAGVGLTTIVAASAGAACLATDSSTQALQLAQRNAAANAQIIARAGGSIETAVLDWLDVAQRHHASVAHHDQHPGCAEPAASLGTSAVKLASSRACAQQFCLG